MVLVQGPRGGLFLMCEVPLQFGETPLQRAVQNFKTSSAQVLLELGASE